MKETKDRCQEIETKENKKQKIIQKKDRQRQSGAARRKG